MIEEQVAQRWVMVYGFLIGFVLLSVLTPTIESVTLPYPQVIFFVAAVMVAG